MSREDAFKHVLSEFLVEIKRSNTTLRDVIKQSSSGSFKGEYSSNIEAFKDRFKKNANAFLEDGGPLNSPKIRDIEIIDGLKCSEIASLMHSVTYANFLMRVMYAIAIAEDYMTVIRIASDKHNKETIDGKPSLFNEILRSIRGSSHRLSFNENETQDDPSTENPAVTINNAVNNVISNMSQKSGITENSNRENIKEHILSILDQLMPSIKPVFENFLDSISEEELNKYNPYNYRTNEEAMQQLMHSDIVSKLTGNLMDTLNHSNISIENLKNDLERNTGISLTKMMNMFSNVQNPEEDILGKVLKGTQSEDAPQ